MRYVFGFLCVCALGVMPVVGCSEAEGPPPECLTACDCDDKNECTDDFCDHGNCWNRYVHCDDGNDCTHDECNPDTGCDYPAKSNDAYCAGSLSCGLCGGVWCCVGDFAGDCRDGECYALHSDDLYVPQCAFFVDCEDGNDCTEDVCVVVGPVQSDRLSGRCENTPVEDGTRCDADLYDEWSASGTCEAGVCVAPCDPASTEPLPCPTEGFERFLCCPCVENCRFYCG